MPKVAPNTRRQGQRRGQLAALAVQHGVSERYLRLIAYGTLDDPAFVQAIRKAAKTPPLWELVAPAALSALFIPTSKIERLGGTLDDLLATLIDSMEMLQDPRNRHFASQTTALQHVDTSLDGHLEARMEADAEAGRRSLKSTKAANEAKAAKADERARRWQAEEEARRPGVSKSTMHAKIARRNNVTVDAVKKAISRHRNRHRTK